ncbi:MAG: hypothetical protein V4581_04335 [Bacteroidota bacterium]
MALWQIDFFMLPKESLQAYPFKKDDEGLFDDTPFWPKKNIDKTFFLPVNDFLPQGNSWSEHVIIFGNETSHRIDLGVHPETGKVESVSLRIDFTKPYLLVLDAILDFCIENNLIILTNPGLEPVALNFPALEFIIESSPQVSRYRQFSTGI